MTDRLTALLGAPAAVRRRRLPPAAHAAHRRCACASRRRGALAVRRAAARELDAGMAEVDRLAAIVDELLVLSRAGRARAARRAARPRGDAAARAARALRGRGRARRRRRRCASTAATPAHGLVRAADLDRALDVLVENALRYSAPRAARSRSPSRPGRIEVRDRGPGPAPGEEEAVFERFHRGAPARRAARARASGCRSPASWRAAGAARRRCAPAAAAARSARW